MIIELDTTRLQKYLDGVAVDMRQVAARTINRVLVTARKNVAKELSQVVSIKQGDLKKKVIGTIKAKKSNLFGALTISGRLVPAVLYKHRAGKRGVSIEFRKGQRALFKHAFKSTVQGPLPGSIVSPGHTGIFQRVKGRANPGHSMAKRLYDRKRPGKLTGKGYADRLPIKQVWGPSVLNVFRGTPELVNRTVQESTVLLDRYAEQELKYLLEKGKAKSGDGTEGEE